MSGKKLAVILITVIVAASLLSVISIQLFFKYYVPKSETKTSLEHVLLTPTSEQFIITLNSR